MVTFVKTICNRGDVATILLSWRRITMANKQQKLLKGINLGFRETANYAAHNLSTATIIRDPGGGVQS